MRKSISHQLLKGQLAKSSGLRSPIASVRVEQAAFDAPWSWLGHGWRDLCAAPRVSLTFGAVFATLSMGLTLGLTARSGVARSGPWWRIFADRADRSLRSV